MYNEVLDRSKPVGRSVAVVGAGGVGFDVAEFLAHGADATGYANLDMVLGFFWDHFSRGSEICTTPHAPGHMPLLGGFARWRLIGACDSMLCPIHAVRYAGSTPNSLPEIADFLGEWGIDADNAAQGGLLEAGAGGAGIADGREIFLLQRKKGKHGARLGRTTGWIHRANLKKRGVKMLGGVTYDRVDDAGLHVTVKEKSILLPVDTVVVCAGQVSVDGLEAPLATAGIPTFKIGGANLAAELDAKRAIDQGSRLAADIESAVPEKVDEYLAPLGTSAKLYQMVTERMG